MSFVFSSIALTTLGALIFKDSLEKSADVQVISNVNGKKYAVLPSGDTAAAADMLATLEDKTREFFAAAVNKYPKDSTIKKIQKQFGSLTEIPQSDTIAYTLDKKDLFICLRDKAGNFQDIDDLFFVLLHELAHVTNSSYGHDEKFWKQFKKILEMAVELEFLPYKNYENYSVVVCGKTINSNPSSCVYQGSCESELTPIRPL